ncbi:hypothetical protein ACFSR7_20595 [Cohnella sp. GCM10020058]|uniref:hypothetical protein n=1 Tax=Cohnella sp. GCM10020058 TaxID=3317330 RepID=UPI0036376CA5
MEIYTPRKSWVLFGLLLIALAILPIKAHSVFDIIVGIATIIGGASFILIGLGKLSYVELAMKGGVTLNNFTIISFAPYSLNYLVYIQNSFLSKKGEPNKFPSTNADWGLLEEMHFCNVFKAVWSEVVGRLSANHLSDHNGIIEKERKLFQRLFNQEGQGKTGFEESKNSFYSWFSSFAGQITIERASDHMMYYETDLYNKLSSDMNFSTKTKHDLLISLIYDNCSLGSSESYYWHSVISLRDLYRDRKSLVPKIADHWNNNVVEQ